VPADFSDIKFHIRVYTFFQSNCSSFTFLYYKWERDRQTDKTDRVQCVKSRTVERVIHLYELAHSSSATSRQSRLLFMPPCTSSDRHTTIWLNIPALPAATDASHQIYDPSGTVRCSARSTKLHWEYKYRDLRYVGLQLPWTTWRQTAASCRIMLNEFIGRTLHRNCRCYDKTNAQHASSDESRSIAVLRPSPWGYTWSPYFVFCSCSHYPASVVEITKLIIMKTRKSCYCKENRAMPL